MMDFIMVPLVVGICVAGTYGLFELFARRKERLLMIEKLGDKLDASSFEGQIKFPVPFPKVSFSALKAGCLLAGIGLGLLIGFVINISVASSGAYVGEGNWFNREIAGTAFGASVLLCGGIGLIIAFIIETKMAKKN
ncbi:hypothetical protein AGMMS49574_11920 [Bacteroidia bacterium]|nr:hypothetical protein AGMMS49574_11920 [Bacteroidia bacterium]GHU54358.1 hypothetical protein FACS189411_00870 [Bacteroidia bacterium]GHV03602.1 hypothetical protein FACS189416_0240 [Bacteroidia bacterium]